MTSFVHSQSPARRLYVDLDSTLSAWVGAAIAIIGMLVASLAIGAAFLIQRRRSRSNMVTVRNTDSRSEKQEAWPDPEDGCKNADEPSFEKACGASPHNDDSGKISPEARQEFVETLRGMLVDEISRGLQASGITDRLDRLEKQAAEQQVLNGAMLPPPPTVSKESGDLPFFSLDNTVKARSGSSERDLPTPSLQPPARVKKCDAQTSTEVSLASLMEAEQQQLQQVSRNDGDILGSRKDLSLSMSSSFAEHLGCIDVPEPIEEDSPLRIALTDMEKVLRKQNVQTQDLHRQLRKAQQECQHQKLESTYFVKQYQELLSDPSFAPAAPAMELQSLLKEAKKLSGHLADSKQSEAHWQIIAQRQRAYFSQSEQAAQEGVNLFRKHPAGELFYTPAAAYAEEQADNSFNSNGS